ncbi:DUF2993 domain-containing protein [Saccharopolyspora oryzae]|uniref:DUF2993 domain-containing protein n=1 Tax=Saccharopolyspora oryzae TaxID=2997343 RepID=A0ABT4UQI2_9PSEU|nr:DUF2993 domain-containing protein [Saccharopolyspora oryzae]MDA3623929.1 DUF2993 domain-containing protein [Saccharopolyspora oryzae]
MKRRGWITLGITLVVLLVVLIVADRMANRFAEQQVAQQLRTQLHSEQEPEVDIRGFPFLTQVLEGDFPDIGVRADSVALGPLQQSGLTADLHHVRVPLDELVSGSPQHVTADQVNGHVRIPAATVGQIAGIDDLQLEPAPGGAITISGNVDVAGFPARAAVTAAVAARDDSIRIEPQALDLRLSRLPNLPIALDDQRLLSRFAVSLDSPELPMGFRPTAVSAEHGALLVDATADHVNLGGQ